MSPMLLANGVGGAGVRAAAAALRRGATALDAAEIGVRLVEDDPGVDSVGAGGLPNLLGEVELDASIMDGRSLRAGAVGALTGYLHPISVARKVMETLPHVFLVGDGAARFAREIRAEEGPLLTDEARRVWEKWVEVHVPTEQRAGWTDGDLARFVAAMANPAGPAAEPAKTGTTTYLTLDRVGDIAAAVSTSGWAFKYPGRLGDSPVIGAGCYADNRFGAAACTGQGELAIRAGTARSVVLYMKMGLGVEAACREAADDLRDLRRDYGGAVTIHAISSDGACYVVTVGANGPPSFWLWTDCLPRPEQIVGEAQPW
jgi:L-asparaginase / beta-aspartyl-peptidase